MVLKGSYCSVSCNVDYRASKGFYRVVRVMALRCITGFKGLKF